MGPILSVQYKLFDASRGVKKRCQTLHRAFTALIYRCHVWHRFLTPRLASKSLYVTLRMGKDFSGKCTIYRRPLSQSLWLHHVLQVNAWQWHVQEVLKGGKETPARG